MALLDDGQDLVVSGVDVWLGDDSVEGQWRKVARLLQALTAPAVAKVSTGTAPDDVVTGTPPLAFAYGFGAFCAFPLRAGATTVLLEQAGPDALLDAIERQFVVSLGIGSLVRELDGRVKRIVLDLGRKRVRKLADKRSGSA